MLNFEIEALELYQLFAILSCDKLSDMYFNIFIGLCACVAVRILLLDLLKVEMWAVCILFNPYCNLQIGPAEYRGH